MLYDNLGYGSYPLILFITSMFTTNIFSYTFYFGMVIFAYAFLNKFKEVSFLINKLKIDYFLMFSLVLSTVTPNILSVKYLPFLFIIHILIFTTKKYVFFMYNYLFTVQLLLVGIFS